MKHEPFQASREMRFRDIHGVYERLDEKNQIREDARQGLRQPSGRLPGSCFVIVALNTREVEMEPEEVKKIASALARQAVAAETGRIAEAVFELLTRVHRISNNRPCTFYFLGQTTRLATIQYRDGEIFSTPITCEGTGFQFKPGWFS